MRTHTDDPALSRAWRPSAAGILPTSPPREGRDGTDARARAIARIEAQADAEILASLGARSAVAAISTILRGAAVEGVERVDVVGRSSRATAVDWYRYGCTPREVERWLEVGVYEAPVAAELRGLYVRPSGPVWSEEVAGLRLGVAVSEGDISTPEVARMYQRA